MPRSGHCQGYGGVVLPALLSYGKLCIHNGDQPYRAKHAGKPCDIMTTCSQKKWKKRCPHRLCAYLSRIPDYILHAIDRWKLHDVGGVGGGWQEQVRSCGWYISRLRRTAHLEPLKSQWKWWRSLGLAAGLCWIRYSLYGVEQRCWSAVGRNTMRPQNLVMACAYSQFLFPYRCRSMLFLSHRYKVCFRHRTAGLPVLRPVRWLDGMLAGVMSLSAMPNRWCSGQEGQMAGGGTPQVATWGVFESAGGPAISAYPQVDLLWTRRWIAHRSEGAASPRADHIWLLLVELQSDLPERPMLVPNSLPLVVRTKDSLHLTIPLGLHLTKLDPSLHLTGLPDHYLSRCYHLSGIWWSCTACIAKLWKTLHT